jgi:hypothetical protein
VRFRAPHQPADSRGDVNNIYNCAAPPYYRAAAEDPCPARRCHSAVPAWNGKQNRHQLDKPVTNHRVPSALGVSFFHMTRRFLADETPANALRTRLCRCAPCLEIETELSCASDSFDSLSAAAGRNRLFDASLLRQSTNRSIWRN